MSEDEDLIGGAARRPRGRPPGSKNSTKPKNPISAKRDAPKVKYKTPEERANPDDMSVDLVDVYHGVSTSWLSQMFGMDTKTVKKKLAGVDGIQCGKGRGGVPLYKLAEVAPYLVKPKVDLIQYVKSLRPNDLPPILNDAYWAAMLKRQKWQENAGDLWRTEDVLAVFGDVSFMFKTTAQLWVEDLDRLHGLSPEMRMTITQQVDRLLDQVHEKMVDLPNRKRTSSSAAEEGAVPPEQQKPESTEEFDVI